MKTRWLSEFFMRRFRPARLRRLIQITGLNSSTRLLDVGGTEFDWKLLPFQVNVILLNRDVDGSRTDSRWVIGDARALPFPDASFDIVYSNSMIEHLGTRENQRIAAYEIARVGRGYFVQTPNRWFPIEPHYLTPFVHYCPASWQRRLLRNFTVWGLLTRPSRSLCDRDVDEIRLLSISEMQELFPGALIIRERFLGLTKSILAVRLPR